MRLTLAALCDAASVRENLLNILGAGATHILRPSYPSPLGATLALQFMINHADAESDHQVVAVVESRNGEVLGRLSMDLVLRQPGLNIVPAGEEVSIPLVAIQLAMVPLPRPGPYVVNVSLDGELKTELPFIAVLVEEDDVPTSSLDLGHAQGTKV